MKVIFIGAVDFSFKMLAKLIDMKVNVVGVVTCHGNGTVSDYSDLNILCLPNYIPVKYVNNINEKESIEWISSLSPDIIFCFGWSQLLKKEVIDIAPMGIIGYHPAALPENRGRHPIIWSLVLGLSEGASTFFFINEGVDSGDIVSQSFFEISYEDDAGTFYEKIIETASNQLEILMPKLIDGSFERFSQHRMQFNVWRKRNKIDGKIDFRMSGRAIYYLVRALKKPYPGAYVEYKNREYKIWKVKELKCAEANIEPGKVIAVNENNQFVVKTFDGAVQICEHEFDVAPKEGEYL